MEYLFEIFGWAGMVLIIAAYALVSFKKMEASARSYQFMNLLGSIGVGVNVFHQQAWPAVALQIVWAMIAVFALSRK